MVTADVKGVKVVLKLAKGSQTISNCSKLASDEELHIIGTAISALEASEVTSITKVVETTLVEE